jgi:TPR repeat protein
MTLSQEQISKCLSDTQNGDSIAQRELGNMYRKGNRVKQSNKEALTWFRKSADQQKPATYCNHQQSFCPKIITRLILVL